MKYGRLSVILLSILLIVPSLTIYQISSSELSFPTIEETSVPDWEPEYIDELDTAMMFSAIEFKGAFYGGGVWSGDIYRSDSKGDNWVSVYDTGENNVRSSAIHNDMLYFSTADDDGIILRSSDGNTWENVLSITGGGFGYNSLISDEKSLLAGTSENGMIYNSKNGENWTISLDTPHQSCNFIIHHGTSYFSSFGNYTMEKAFFYESKDGENWTFISSIPYDCDGCPCIFYNDSYLISTRNGIILKTTDFSDFSIIFDSGEQSGIKADLQITTMSAFRQNLWIGLSGGLEGDARLVYTSDLEEWNIIPLSDLSENPMKLTCIFYQSNNDDLYFTTGDHWNYYPHARIYRIEMEPLIFADTYVDNSGSDTFGNGTVNNPYKTLMGRWPVTHE